MDDDLNDDVLGASAFADDDIDPMLGVDDDLDIGEKPLGVFEEEEGTPDDKFV
ncbi:MAG: hypothetical protein M3Q34_01405 [bacterium]|nr:hypothetical protein [bacterium]